MPEGSATTLLVRNLPRRYRGEDLLKEIEPLVGVGLVDFLHVPLEGAVRNKAFGVVNFVSPDAASAARNMLQGKRWNQAERAKPAKVLVADVQGFAANVERAERSAATRDPSAMPLVFLSGEATDFSAALRFVHSVELAGSEESSQQKAAQRNEPRDRCREEPRTQEPQPSRSGKDDEELTQQQQQQQQQQVQQLRQLQWLLRARLQQLSQRQRPRCWAKLQAEGFCADTAPRDAWEAYVSETSQTARPRADSDADAGHVVRALPVQEMPGSSHNSFSTEADRRFAEERSDAGDFNEPMYVCVSFEMPVVRESPEADGLTPYDGVDARLGRNPGYRRALQDFQAQLKEFVRRYCAAGGAAHRQGGLA